MEERKSDQYAIDVFADHAAHTQHILLAIILTLAVLLVACVGVIIWQADARVKVEREHAEQLRRDLCEAQRFAVHSRADPPTRESEDLPVTDN